MVEFDSLKSLAKIDLNLLVTLHALLETNSTTLAAERVHRTQSAVSIALGKLRQFFNDPLFIRHGPKLTPTEFAIQLKQPLSLILFELSALIENDNSFNFRETHRQITLAIPDIAQSMITDVVNQIRQDAPNLDIVMANSSLEMTDYDEGIRLLLNGKIDLLMSFYIGQAPQGIHLEKLDNQQWSVFANSRHPISSAPSLEEWASFRHVQIASGEKGRSPITDLLANTNVSRKIGLKVSSFLQALHIVAESDLLFTTMVPLARPIASKLSLKEVPLPLSVPDVPLCIMTRAIQFDPLSNWLLEQVLNKYQASNENVY